MSLHFRGYAMYLSPEAALPQPGADLREET